MHPPQRIALAALASVTILLAFRDLWHLCVLLSGGTVIRYHLLMKWRFKTFHIERLSLSYPQMFEPWAFVLLAAVSALFLVARRRGLLRYAMGICAFGLLLRWVVKDILAIYDASSTYNHHIDSAHSFEYAQHHAETVLPAALAEAILQRIEQARQIAEASNATDHDWLHAMRGVRYPIIFSPPDYYFAFPWSFVFLFLFGLAASALTHRYSVHWTTKGRIRFVKRYPDPEETETNDTWDNLVDNPDLDPATLSLGDQLNSRMDSINSGESTFASSVPKSETPLVLFPIKDPNESQIAIGDQLRERRDFQRRMARNAFLAVFLIFFLLDVTSIYTVASMRHRIAAGLMKNPNTILIIDLGVVPENYSAPTAVDQVVVDPATNLTTAKGYVDPLISFTSNDGATPHHYPQRPPPLTREWIPEYQFPATPFVIVVMLIKLAVPPLFAPRVRLRLYKDKLVAIPLSYPVQYKSINFEDIVAIEIKGEETPSGTLFLRHRKYVKTEGFIVRTRKFKIVRGYLYSGLGDLGKMSPEDHYLVMLRTRDGAEDWGVQVQGMSVERLRDILDGAISEFHGVPQSGGASSRIAIPSATPASCASLNKLARAEAALLNRHVKTPFRRQLVQLTGKDWAINTFVLNGPPDGEPLIDPKRSTLVLMHGYGSGLGFFYTNYDALARLRDPSGARVQIVAADWLGCGGSARPPFAVRKGVMELEAARSDSKSSTNPDSLAVSAAENYFVDAFEDWRAELGIEKMALVGHSLGGYLAAVYAIKHPQRLHSLTLLSPFGLLSHPKESRPLTAPDLASQLPFAQRMFLTAWSNNITPQWILRSMGPYGQRMASNIVSRRFPTLDDDDKRLISDYVYHLSTIRPAAGEYALNALMELRSIPANPGEVAGYSGPPRTRAVRFGLFARHPVGVRMFERIPVHLPITILFGDSDWMFSNSREILGLKLVTERTTSKLHVVSNAGHHLYLDNPEEMHKVVEDSPLWGLGKDSNKR
ncbi:hypothetical protein HDU84_000473 [Entophlyctis sp. JEL0112]|nr:hypothetical protein HDU84_000473 [Entophlyctis sp. JEL0112]